MLFHKTQSDLALKLRKVVSRRIVLIWIEAACKVSFLIQKKMLQCKKWKKHVTEMGAWEISIFKVWTQSKVPKLEVGDNQILSNFQN